MGSCRSFDVLVDFWFLFVISFLLFFWCFGGRRENGFVHSSCGEKMEMKIEWRVCLIFGGASKRASATIVNV